MKLFRALALLAAAALLAPFARPASAQGVKIAGEPPPAAGAPKAGAPKKKAAKPKKKSAKKKKSKPAPESKYTSRAMSENGQGHYRFDEDGNSISGAAKKPAPKAKPACTDDAPCSDKKSSDADSL